MGRYDGIRRRHSDHRRVVSASPGSSDYYLPPAARRTNPRLPRRQRMAFQPRGNRSMGARASRSDRRRRTHARRRAKRKAGSRASSRKLFRAPAFLSFSAMWTADETSQDRRPSQIAAYFSRLSDTYGDGAYYGNRRKAVLEAIAPEFADAREVLDVGCGNGAYLTKFVAAPGNRARHGSRPDLRHAAVGAQSSRRAMPADSARTSRNCRSSLSRSTLFSRAT